MIGQFKFKGKPEFNFRELKVKPVPESIRAVYQIIDEMQEDKVYTIRIDEYKDKRTLDQNAYMWVLLQRLSEKLKIPHEDLYRTYIKSAGQYQIACVQDKDVKNCINDWSRLGIGWFCETDISKIPNCTNVKMYRGTSVYDKEQMSLIIDSIIDDCKEFEISTEVKGYGCY